MSLFWTRFSDPSTDIVRYKRLTEEEAAKIANEKGLMAKVVDTVEAHHLAQLVQDKACWVTVSHNFEVDPFPDHLG